MITVVSGLPRSGTSLMMQMLQAGGLPVLADEVRTADANNPRGYLEFEPVKRLRQEAGWLAAAEGKAVKVVAPLLAALPPVHAYRVLFMVRELDEVLRSQQRMLEQLGRSAEAGRPDVLAPVFRRQVESARQWAEAQPNVQLLEIPYAALVADSHAWAARIDAFLGGSLDAGAMAAQVDPALYRQRGL